MWRRPSASVLFGISLLSLATAFTIGAGVLGNSRTAYVNLAVRVHDTNQFTDTIIVTSSPAQRCGIAACRDTVDWLLIELRRQLGIPVTLITGLATSNQSLDRSWPYRRNSITFLLLDTLSPTRMATSKAQLIGQLAAYLNDNVNSKVIVLVLDDVTTNVAALAKQLRALFTVFWRNYMLNVIVTFCDGDGPNNVSGDSVVCHVYGYYPFDGFRLRNVTAMKPREMFLTGGRRQFKTLVLRVNLGHEVPKLLVYTDPDGKLQTRGPDGRMFETIIAQLGAQFTRTVIRTSASYDETHKKLMRNEIDLIANTWPININGEIGLGKYTYPIQIEWWCVLAPAAGAYPQYMNIILPFEPAVWMAIVFAYLIAALVVRAITRCPCAVDRHQRNHETVNLFRIMIFQPWPCDFSRMSWPQLAFVGPFTVYAFMITNWYLAVLTSFLTRPMQHRELNTYADLGAANIKVLGLPKEVAIVRTIPDADKRFLANLREVESVAEFLALRDAYNLSYAYLCPSDRARFLLQQQAASGQKYFHLTEQCQCALPMAFRVNKDSPFEAEVTRVIIRIFEAGIYQLWFSRTFTEAFQLGFANKTVGEVVTGNPVPLTVDHLQMAFYILVIGQSCSIVLFVAEMRTAQWGRRRW